MIQVENLTKSYGTLKAVDALSFTVPKGTVFGLLGANGAGKSTTLECLVGTKTPDGGTVSILGLSPMDNRKHLFEKVGVQFQEAAYQENIRVAELCEVTAALYKSPADYCALLDRFDLAHKKGAYVKTLSGGERQKLFVVLALIPDPEVVLLDELTTGLDAKARRRVWKLLKTLKAEGLTILLTSHFMDEVETLCDAICILKKGQVVFSGSVASAIDASPYTALESAYLWHTGEEVLDDEHL